jgi:hypothetical protein
MAVRYFQTDDRLLYVRDRQRFGKVIEELNAENTEGDDIKTSEEICTFIYPSAPAPRLPMKEAGLSLDTLVVHGYSIMRWRLVNQDGFADSSCSNVGEARH